MSSGLALGIDIGTTTTAASVIDSTRKPLAHAGVTHKAGLPAGAADIAEQDPNRIFESVRIAVTSLPADLRRRVRSIGVTGQMHGCLFLDKTNLPLSPLITWQDNRANRDGFLARLNESANLNLSAGFAFATVAYLLAQNQLPPDTTQLATIPDYITARLTASKNIKTDPTLAHSMGLFDLQSICWDKPAFERANIPLSLAPQIAHCSTPIGALCPDVAKSLQLPPGIGVTVALGDNQASILALTTDPDAELYLIMGTGAQLSALTEPDFTPPARDAHKPYEYRPFPGGRYIFTTASVAGGCAWAWLPETITAILKDLNIAAPAEDDLYRKLNALADPSGDIAPLTFTPTFTGRRHSPDVKASIENITATNFTLSNLTTALAEGIITELKINFPEHILKQKTRLIAAGNTIQQNSKLQTAAKKILNLPLTIGQIREPGDTGAAINSLITL